jgi:hypothetical protein
LYVIHFQPTSSLKSVKVAEGVEVRFQFGEKDNLVVRIETPFGPPTKVSINTRAISN